MRAYQFAHLIAATAIMAGGLAMSEPVEQILEMKLPPGNFIQFPVKGEYQCVILDTHDSDTTVVGLIVPVKIRLRNCDGVELKSQNGMQARNAFMKLLPQQVPLSTVYLYGLENYGRTLGDFKTEPGGFWVSDKMVELGWAKKWDGRGPKPVQ